MTTVSWNYCITIVTIALWHGKLLEQIKFVRDRVITQTNLIQRYDVSPHYNEIRLAGSYIMKLFQRCRVHKLAVNSGVVGLFTIRIFLKVLHMLQHGDPRLLGFVRFMSYITKWRMAYKNCSWKIFWKFQSLQSFLYISSNLGVFKKNYIAAPTINIVDLAIFIADPTTNTVGSTKKNILSIHRLFLNDSRIYFFRVMFTKTTLNIPGLVFSHPLYIFFFFLLGWKVVKGQERYLNSRRRHKRQAQEALVSLTGVVGNNETNRAAEAACLQE